MSKKVRIRLTHICNVPGCEGYPGAVVEVPADKAEWLIEIGGAVAVDDAPQPSAEEAPDETLATDSEQAAPTDSGEAEARPKRRSRKKRKAKTDQ